MNEQILQSQGLLDIFKLTDGEVIENLAKLVKAIDVDKIKQILDAIEIKDDYIHIKFDLSIKR